MWKWMDTVEDMMMRRSLLDEVKVGGGGCVCVRGGGVPHGEGAGWAKVAGRWVVAHQRRLQ